MIHGMLLSFSQIVWSYSMDVLAKFGDAIFHRYIIDDDS